MGRFVSTQPQPRLVDERGGLKRVARFLTRHSMRGQLAQLVVNERQQFLRCFGLTSLQPLDDGRHVAHEGQDISNFGAREQDEHEPHEDAKDAKHPIT